MMKRFVIFAAAALTAIGLTACSSSSSSTTTTSTTVNGITTTTEVTTITENGKTRKEVVKTVTDENGNVLSVTNGDGEPINTADEKETEAANEAEAVNEAEAAIDAEAADETEAVADNAADEDDSTGLRAKWHEMFYEGAEGENENGDHFFFAYDDRDDVRLGSVMVLNADMTELATYYLGEVGTEDDAMVIYDNDLGMKLPFTIEDGTEDGTLKMSFMDGDVAEMHFVDQDTIINDMIGVVENLNI